MDIGEISGGNLPVSSGRIKKAKEEKPVEKVKKDRIEISSEAQSLLEADKNARFDEIQKKIAQGYYARHEVMVQVVDALMKDLA